MLRARLGRPAISAILDSARAARPRFKRGRKNLRGWVEKVQVACEFKAHGAVPSGKAEVCKGLLPFSFCAPRRRKYSVGVRLVVGRVSAPVIGPAGGLRAGSHWFTTSPKTALEMSSRKSRGWRFPIRVHARPLRNVTNAARSSSGWYSWKPRSASRLRPVPQDGSFIRREKGPAPRLVRAVEVAGVALRLLPDEPGLG